MNSEVRMLEFLSWYASGWVGMYQAAVAFGTATDLRYVLTGLPVAALAGYVDHRYNVRHGYRRLSNICSVTVATTLSFFVWPVFLAIHCLMGALFVPIFFVLISMVLLLKFVHWSIGGRSPSQS